MADEADGGQRGERADAGREGDEAEVMGLDQTTDDGEHGAAPGTFDSLFSTHPVEADLMAVNRLGLSWTINGALSAARVVRRAIGQRIASCFHVRRCLDEGQDAAS